MVLFRCSLSLSSLFFSGGGSLSLYNVESTSKGTRLAANFDINRNFRLKSTRFRDTVAEWVSGVDGRLVLPVDVLVNVWIEFGF